MIQKIALSILTGLLVIVATSARAGYRDCTPYITDEANLFTEKFVYAIDYGIKDSEEIQEIYRGIIRLSIRNHVGNKISSIRESLSPEKFFEIIQEMNRQNLFCRRSTGPYRLKTQMIKMTEKYVRKDHGIVSQRDACLERRQDLSRQFYARANPNSFYETLDAQQWAAHNEFLRQNGANCY